MRNYKFFLILLFTGFVLFSCKNPEAGNTTQPEPNKLISVSILPQLYFTEKVAGDDYDIHVMIPPGSSPASYDPTPRQMAALASSHLYLRIGRIRFEEIWMERIRDNQPSLIIRDISEGVGFIENPEHHHHESDSQDGHTHGPSDPHIWMSPKNGLLLAENTYRFLKEAFPSDSALFRKNFLKLQEEIMLLIDRYEKSAPQLEGLEFLIYHPALTYLAMDYSMKQHVLEQDGKEPTPSHMNSTIREAREKHIRSIFVQKQFNMDNARQIAREIDGEIIPLDPLDPEWNTQLEKILDILLEISKHESHP